MARKASKGGRRKAKAKPRRAAKPKKRPARKPTKKPAKVKARPKKAAKPAPPPAPKAPPVLRPVLEEEETVCALEFLSDGRSFIARLDTMKGGMREHRAPSFMDLLELVAEDLREEFLEI